MQQRQPSATLKSAQAPGPVGLDPFYEQQTPSPAAAAWTPVCRMIQQHKGPAEYSVQLIPTSDARTTLDCSMLDSTAGVGRCTHTADVQCMSCSDRPQMNGLSLTDRDRNKLRSDSVEFERCHGSLGLRLSMGSTVRFTLGSALACSARRLRWRCPFDVNFRVDFRDHGLLYRP